MKIFFKIIPLVFLIISCADDSKISEPNQDILVQGTLQAGENTIPTYKESTLHTIIYSMPEQATDNIENMFSNLTLVGLGSKDVATSPYLLNNKYMWSIINTPKIDESNAKSRLNRRIAEFHKYAKRNNIKPIKEHDVNLKQRNTNIDIGSKWENVYVVEHKATETITATCIAISQYAYFFLEDGLEPITEEQINIIKESFDKDYLIVHEKFGKENDIDKNGKIIFLITDIPEQIMGFFYSIDKYARTDTGAERSNEADILYINHKYFAAHKWQQAQTDLLATFIHEFQHMVLFDSRINLNLDPVVNPWVNEGFSMLAEYYGGYGKAHKNYLTKFLTNNQGLSLLQTSYNEVDYGYALLFIRYLVERFGDQIVHKIYNEPSTDISSISKTTTIDFNELFQDFTKMLLLTGTGLTEDKKYNIPNFNHKEGTEEYEKNGFNIRKLIDEIYSTHKNDKFFITQNGYTTRIMPYSFLLSKWKGNHKYIYISDSNNVGGFYAAF